MRVGALTRSRFAVHTAVKSDEVGLRATRRPLVLAVQQREQFIDVCVRVVDVPRGAEHACSARCHYAGAL